MKINNKVKEIKKDILVELQSKMDKEVSDRVKKHNITGRLERNTKTKIIGDKVISRTYSDGMMVASGRKFIFSKKVNHQGYKGDPYLYDALKATARDIEKIKKQAIRKNR